MRYTTIELADGSRCHEDVVPLNVGACFYEEMSNAPDRTGRSGLVRCGEKFEVCGRDKLCECAQPRALFDCEPERTVTIESDGGITPIHPTRGDGTVIPPLRPREFEGRNEFGTCRFSMGPPRMGRCNIGGLIPNQTEEQLQIGLYVPFEEDRELCGVRVSCRCSEFTKRE
ncbi:MAG: hypothetical protein M3Q39_06905 [Actinomycetota bacterium]|nr:hypothetical protein [Actinomycetota bacterium]